MVKTLAVAAVALTPALAAACPVCARDGNPNALLLVSALIATPYVVAAFVIRAIRRHGDEP